MNYDDIISLCTFRRFNLFDQITKILIKNWIPLGQSVTIIPGFWIFILLTTPEQHLVFLGKLQLLSLISILATIVWLIL